MASAPHPHIPDAATVRNAFRRLPADTAPRWGSMSAPAMLEHCARFNEIYLGRRRPSWFVRTMARLLGGPMIRRMAARSPFAMPRGMRTLPDLRVDQPPTDPEAVEALRARVLATFDEIEARTGTWDHPLYGPIDAGFGKALARHHAAHHLHQFGQLKPPTAA